MADLSPQPSSVRSISIGMYIALSTACALASGCGGDRVAAHSVRVGPYDAAPAQSMRLGDCPATCGAHTDTQRDAPVDLDDATVELSYGPLLGAVSDRSIRVWVRGERAGHFAVRLWPVGMASAQGAVKCSAPTAIDEAGDFTGVVSIDHLEPSTRYAYRIEVESTRDATCVVPVTQAHEFRTLSREGEPERVRFVVAADVAGPDIPGFSDIDAVSPDFVLMIGDNVYADGFGTRFEDYQLRYQNVWGGVQFRTLFAHTPTFMIWDDHEILENYWLGKDDAAYAAARKAYDLYQNSHNPEPLAPGELYYTFRAADIGFFVFDTRTHRSPNTDPDDENKTMLGAAQRQAFEAWLAEDDSRVHVIVSSVLFSKFSTTGKDAWKSFSTERDALLAVIAENETANTFIVSGDQHWSAVLRIAHDALEDYSLYEFQSTPIGSGERPAPEEPDETVIGLDNQQNVFAVFDVDTRADPPTLDFTMCGVNANCSPHTEPAPVTSEVSHTTLPYSLHFRGGPAGFSLIEK
jgi:phosphodiesterase/alkaline phosphatase D-like protein